MLHQEIHFYIILVLLYATPYNSEQSHPTPHHCQECPEIPETYFSSSEENDYLLL